MASPLRLKTHHNPSLLNEDMALGAFVGTLAAPVIGTLIGALIGGLIGKNAQEAENRSGKPVGTPSFWNKDAVLGGFIGGFAGIVAGVALLMIAGVAIASSAPLAIPTGAAIAAFGSVVGGVILGTYLGGKSGEARMTHELEEARQQRIVQYISHALSVEIVEEVTQGKHWSEKIRAEKHLSGPEKAR